MIQVLRRQPNIPVWHPVCACQFPATAAGEIALRRCQDDLVDPASTNDFYIYKMQERCDVCGALITEENQGQSTAYGIICIGCLRKGLGK